MIRIKVDCLNLGSQSIKKLTNYFKYMKADCLYMEDDYLKVHLNTELVKSTKWYIFIQDIQFFVNLRPKTVYKNSYIYIYF